MNELLAVNHPLDEKINGLLNDLSIPETYLAEAIDPATIALIDNMLAQGLSEQELGILIRYFGLDGNEPVALETLAGQFGQPPNALAERLEQILGKLRQATPQMAVPEASIMR